jgi:hypothetical protein
VAARCGDVRGVLAEEGVGGDVGELQELRGGEGEMRAASIEKKGGGWGGLTVRRRGRWCCLTESRRGGHLPMLGGGEEHRR